MPDFPSLHPVPAEQQPLNQYAELRSSRFFMWPSLSGWPFWWGVIQLWLWVAVVGGSLAASTLTLPQDWMRLLIVAAEMGNGAVILMLLRLYLAWQHIQQRLTDPTIFYEESGWYDGTTYQKTDAELQQQRLVAQYEVAPLQQRLRRSLSVIALFSVAGIGLWWWT